LLQVKAPICQRFIADICLWQGRTLLIAAGTSAQFLQKLVSKGIFLFIKRTELNSIHILFSDINLIEYNSTAKSDYC